MLSGKLEPYCILNYSDGMESKKTSNATVPLKESGVNCKGPTMFL